MYPLERYLYEILKESTYFSEENYNNGLGQEDTPKTKGIGTVWQFQVLNCNGNLMLYCDLIISIDRSLYFILAATLISYNSKNAKERS
jgi:hypothetical protein